MEIERESLFKILNNHLTRTPDMQLQDVYKLLHQAALGSEHAVGDEQAVQDWMNRELVEMGAGPDDPLVDPIAPDGQIVRIHLRPYIRAGKDPQALLQAFIRTANEWHGSPDQLKSFGQSAAQFAREGLLPFHAGDLGSYFIIMEQQGFPAAHHTEVYERLYRPAYRVVAIQFLEES